MGKGRVSPQENEALHYQGMGGCCKVVPGTRGPAGRWGGAGKGNSAFPASQFPGGLPLALRKRSRLNATVE